MYKIINDLAAPNLKQLFRPCNEGDSPYELRNCDTDLILINARKNFLIEVSNIMELTIRIIYLQKLKQPLPSIHLRES